MSVRKEDRTALTGANPEKPERIAALPESVLLRIYSEPDELEKITAEQLSRFQSQTDPE